MNGNITLERDEEGRYVAECTDLPGCLSEGETVQEAIKNISEAIVGCLKSRLNAHVLLLCTLSGTGSWCCSQESRCTSMG
ncbi:MAG TPA: type II toxin-antitoxin system HicB family antitoxin [Methanomicrobia archaeon]|nr:type II toxin-antitoxin system HicB family antitoxin [Methanomicrobia archaeon]